MPSVTRGLPEKSQMRADVGEAVTLEQARDVRRLVAAVFQQQPAAVVQMRRGACAMIAAKASSPVGPGVSAMAGSAASLSSAGSPAAT